MKSKNEDTIKIEGFRKKILRSNADKLVYVIIDSKHRSRLIRKVFRLGLARDMFFFMVCREKGLW